MKAFIICCIIGLVCPLGYMIAERLGLEGAILYALGWSLGGIVGIAAHWVIHEFDERKQ